MGFRSGTGAGSAKPFVGVLAVILVGLTVAAVRSCGADGSVPPRVLAARQAEGVSPSGLVASRVAAWLDRTATPSALASSSRREALLSEFAASTSRAQIGRQLETTASSFEGDDAAGLVLRAVPLGYRLRSLNGRRAVVETQQIVLQASPGTATAGLLATGRLVLVHEGSWRVADATVSALPLSQLSRGRLASIDAGFRGFRHVP